MSRSAMEESSPSSRSASNKSSQCSTEALFIVLVCFFTLCSCFTSSVVDLAIKDVKFAETNNMKAAVDLSLPLDGYHVELASLESTYSPFTSVPDNLDGIVTTEVMNDVSVDSIEHYQLATSNSKSRSVCCGWWSWVQRLILMSFCLMVGEGSSGTPPKDNKRGEPSSSSSSKETLEQKRRDYAMYLEELRKFNLEVEAARKEERDREFRNLIGIMLGGSDKIFKYFCEVFQQKCREHNREYEVLEAADVWLGMRDSEKRVYAEGAMRKYFQD